MTPESMLELNNLEFAWMAGAVDLDASAFLSALIFLGLYFVLNELLFKPYLAIVEKRDAMTSGAEDDATSLTRSADEAAAEYEERRLEARAEAVTLRDRLRAEGKSKEEEIVNAARQRAAEIMAARRQEVSYQLAAAEVQLDIQARELSKAMASRMVADA